MIGCTDGTHVHIQAPSGHQYLYVNGKGFHSVNVNDLRGKAVLKGYKHL